MSEWWAIALVVVTPYAQFLSVWFGWLLPRSLDRQDRLWREHYAEQRRLDHEAGVVTRSHL